MFTPYLRLMRLGNPIGIWLLMWPGFWAVALASKLHGMTMPWPALTTIALGAALMRSAGCVVNDLTDEDLDRHVARTRLRPLAAGTVPRRHAQLLALLLTAAAGALILPYGWPATLTAMAALPLVVLYPRMKRITWWPQVFLGLTFNWGALLGWVMVTDGLEWPALALYLGGIAWTVGYDTIYAHQDQASDALIGVRSTARLFGARSPRAISLCFFLAFLAWATAAGATAPDPHGLVAMLALAAFFCWQVAVLEPENPAVCDALFRAHGLVGWLLLLALL